MEKSLYKLKIDSGFKSLIRPLLRAEYEQLASNIIHDGCREPLVTWRGTIIDGHNRYEICHKFEIPFTYVEREFDSREDVISWICSNQLGRRNISEETRKYLIGKRYEVEKVINTRRNASGVNQYSPPVPEHKLSRAEMIARTQGHKTSTKLGEEYHLSHGTVQKYAIYSKAIDAIGSKDATLAPKILSGKYKISHENVVELSHLPAGEVRKISRKIDSQGVPFVRFSRSRREIQEQAEQHRAEQLNGPTIKDMPAYDPDAEVTGLTLTIPSWTSSINRAMTSADLDKISDGARDKLKDTLNDLIQSVESILSCISKENDYGSGL